MFYQAHMTSLLTYHSPTISFKSMNDLNIR